MMKRIFITLIAILSIGFKTGAQAPQVPVDSTNIQILNELREIKVIQDSTFKQRQEAIANRQRNASKDGDTTKVKSDVDLLSIIESNTHQHPKKDGWNLYGWVAFIVALISLIVAGITLWAQKQTEKHTQNAPISAQIGQFKDLTRHLYRNLVCTSAAIASYRNKNNKLPNRAETDTKYEAYPSESNFNKLKTMPDDVILDIDVDERTYEHLHELRVLLRNYNIEVDVASSHISNPTVWDKAIKQDFDNLLFKPLHLVKAAFEPESLLMSADSGLLSLPDRSIMILIEEHFEKLMSKSNFNSLGENCAQEYLKSFFGPVQGTKFTASSKNAIVQSAKDAYKTMIDSKNSLWRSLNNLAQSGLELYGSSITTKSGKDYLVSISKESFINYLESRNAEICSDINKLIKQNKCKLFWAKLFAAIWLFNREKYKREVKVLNASSGKLEKQLKSLQEKKLVKFVKALSSVPTEDGYKSFSEMEPVNYDVKKKENVSYEELYNSIKPYLAFINQDVWMFNDMLYVMLAVDASIEVNRIGMVNYE